MAYIINRTNGTQLTVVEDGTIDQTTDLKLVGKNYAGYGEIENENLVSLLENFSSSQSPARPISGQIWFDSSNSKLKFYDGAKFRTTGGAEVSTTQPVGLTEGDFWWDNENNQLYANSGDGGFVLIGPQSQGDTITQMVTTEVRDTVGNIQTVIRAVVNDETIFITSSTQFTIDSSDSENAITGFDVIRQGLTLRNTTDSTLGVTSSDHRYWGTATNALKLGGVDAANFIQSTPGEDAVFNTIARFTDAGLTVGTSNDLLIAIENDNEGVIKNQVGNEIKFSVTDNAQEVDVAQILETGINPLTTVSFDLGSASFKWRTMYANSFNGLATSSSAVRVSGSDLPGSTSATNNTVAIRDASANITANEFIGTATQAKYADLAEVYSTATGDSPVGTVMAISANEDFEADVAQPGDVAVGVISEKPAYLMNADAEGEALALKGRVPVRILGAVNKGDRVFVAQNGLASAEGAGDLVGIALESNSDASEKLVECLLKV